MKRISIPLLIVLAIGVVFALSGCSLLGTDYSLKGNGIYGYIYGVSDIYNNPVTVTDDLGESTVADYSSYSLDTKPGVRTITYSCTGYATVSTTVSVIGGVKVNVTMNPIAQGVSG